MWSLEQGYPYIELRGLPEYLSNLHLCNPFTMPAQKSRGTSDTSLALLMKQHLAMASSSRLTQRLSALPVSIAGAAAVFQLWQVCCCGIASSQTSFHSSEPVVTAVCQSLDTAMCTARLSG